MFLIWDAYTVYSVWMHSRYKRKTASGVPIISLVVYAIVCVPDKRWVWLGVLTLYHILCQFIVPIMIIRFLEKSQRE